MSQQPIPERQIPSEVLRALDRWIMIQPAPMTRTEAICQVLCERLVEDGAIAKVPDEICRHGRDASARRDA